LATQDRAILLAGAGAYREGLATGSELARPEAIAERLAPPFRAYSQEVVRLDLFDDGLRARGVVLVHADVFEGVSVGAEFAENGMLFAVEFVRERDRWLMSAREPTGTLLQLPPERPD
jgi:hypothetical protein